MVYFRSYADSFCFNRNWRPCMSYWVSIGSLDECIWRHLSDFWIPITDGPPHFVNMLYRADFWLRLKFEVSKAKVNIAEFVDAIYQLTVLNFIANSNWQIRERVIRYYFYVENNMTSEFWWRWSDDWAKWRCSWRWRKWLS